MIVAFTGHRPEKLGDLIALQEKLSRDFIDEILEELSPDLVISGMAPGIDTRAIRSAARLNIPARAAIPWIGHAQKDPVGYLELLEKCAEHVVVCPGDEYKPWFFQLRNEYMVDHCDLLLAVWDGTSGGTANCVKYATRTGRPMMRLDMKTGEWHADVPPLRRFR